MVGLESAAIRIDERLDVGRTDRSKTFGNKPLTMIKLNDGNGKTDFQLLRFEVIKI
jgi:hypothetical protein